MIFMAAYNCMSRQALESEHRNVLAQFEHCKKQKLNLNIARGKPSAAQLDLVMEKDLTLVAVCNGRYYGGGFMPMPEARMDDGIMNVMVVDKISKLQFLKFVGLYSKGEYKKVPQVAHGYTPKVVRIRSEQEDIVTCLDGECFRSREVVLRLADKKVNFFGPAGCSPNATAR